MSDARRPTTPSSVYSVTVALARNLRAAIDQQQPLQPILEKVDDPSFICGCGGIVVACNRLYCHIFCNAETAVGRIGKNFLHPSLQSISEQSDKLMAYGCRSVEFQHPGRTGRTNLPDFVLRTVKVSLTDCGVASLAFVGVTRVITPTKLPRVGQTLLVVQWTRFEQLNACSREIAICIARGESAVEIAGRLDISVRTVENRRSNLLSIFEIDRSVQLVHLLCNFQWAGLADFGF